MTHSKETDNRMVEITIQNLIKATKEGKCVWIKSNFDRRDTNYHLMIKVESTKMVNFKIYQYNGDDHIMNVYITQSGGNNYIQIFSITDNVKIKPIIDTIETGVHYSQLLV
jgi:hypothetical protein